MSREESLGRGHRLWPVLAAILLMRPGWVVGVETDLQARIRRALPGSTLRIPAGRYRGPLVIDRPIRLVGEGGPVIDGQGRGTVVWVRAGGVTVEGFVIRGSGDSLTDEDAGIRVEDVEGVRIIGNRLEDVLFGVYLKNTHASEITANTVVGRALPLGRRGDGIRLWWSNDNIIKNNYVSGVRDVIAWFSRDVRWEGNTVTDSRYGLHFMYVRDADVRHNRFERNSTGVVVMYSQGVQVIENDVRSHDGPSAVGILLKDSDAVRVVRNRIVGNKAGIFWDNSPSRADAWNDIRENLLLWNAVAFVFQPNVRWNRIVHNFVVENLQAVEVSGGGTVADNEWTQDGRGNFWSDYIGYDLQGDGIGDVPYRAEALLDRLTDRYPQLRLLAWSPAGVVLEWVSRVFPLFPVQPRVEDPRPWMELPAAVRSMFPRPESDRGPWVFGSLVMGWLGLMGIWGLRRRPSAPAIPPTGAGAYGGVGR